MSKKVLILSGSPRKGGNSDLLCDEFAKGAAEAGHDVEKVRVAEKNIGYCRACYGCRGTGKCVIRDDMAELLDKMVAADVLVLASPVYFYSVDAQLKALIDRCLARFMDMKNKELYYIATAGDTERSGLETTLACFHGFADCLPGAKEMGTVYGAGVYELGAVRVTPMMQEAYNMGKNV